MIKRKRTKDKGKVSLTRYFQEFKIGDSVAVVRDLSHIFGYSTRVQGKTGKVISKKGKAYNVEIYDMNKLKKYFIRAIHLKKIQSQNDN